MLLCLWSSSSRPLYLDVGIEIKTAQSLTTYLLPMLFAQALRASQPGSKDLADDQRQVYSYSLRSPMLRPVPCDQQSRPMCCRSLSIRSGQRSQHRSQPPLATCVSGCEKGASLRQSDRISTSWSITSESFEWVG